MRFNEILADATGAANSSHFDVTDKYPVSVVLKGTGIATEIHKLQAATDNDEPTTNWEDVYFESNLIVLEAGNTTVITVRGPGRYRIVKVVTASDVGFVAVSSL